MSTVRFRYENGVLKPVDPAPLPLDEGQEIEVDLHSNQFFELEELTDAQSAELARRQKAALKRVCGMIKGGPADLSSRVDDVLYGESTE